MKRFILLSLLIVTTIVMSAADITPEQALQYAQSFLHEKGLGGKGKKMAASKPKLAGSVDGLYVFNTGENGFVIVSNDDQTFPILGYSNTDTLDIENIPSNMRAWLQGYADEIRQIRKGDMKYRHTARRVSSVKKPIEPLIHTRWNQSAPYNNNCPIYSGIKRAVTGCVATAMAQIMYYHRYAEMSGGIEGYNKDGNGASCVSVNSLPQTTFDWNNMVLNYNGSESSAQKAAVAKLMQYCGASVKMNYGKPSLAYSFEVAPALINIFGYKSTAQLAIRSLYSYDEWIDIIYNELEQGRPVWYCGYSSESGHAFVCDGYQGEDFFHINWGWGGQSDSYFKLSALDPDQQGIGGNNSADGYCYGQNAVIGIQRPTDNGTLLDITYHFPDLKVNSVTCASSIAVGELSDISLNITNNAATDYSGDIFLGIKYGQDDYKILDGFLFSIPAGDTKDCVIPTKFTTAGTFDLVVFYPDLDGGYNTDDQVIKTVTVTYGNNTTTSDLKLKASLKSLENANSDKTEVYGNYIDKTIKAVISVSNPSTTKNFRGHFRVYLRDADYPTYNCWIGKTITIPAGGSYDFEFNAPNQDLKRRYKFYTCYIRTGNTLTSEVNVGSTFRFLPGITTYTTDGAVAAIKGTNHFDVPASAATVDLSGIGVVSVTKNSNPNTLYIIGENDATPAGLTNNIVKKESSGDYIAENITIADGYDFASPVNITCNKVEFVYTFTTGADGTNGWNTIILPYDVTRVTADDMVIDWFHNSNENNKQFWIKEFVSDDAPNIVNFDYLSGNIKANTPYIVAFPGDRWGSAYDLSTKTIKFIGENVTISRKDELSPLIAGYYRFIGNTVQDNTSNIYRLTSKGNRFELGNGCAPFRAYFKLGVFDPSLSSLTIGGKIAASINDTDADTSTDGCKGYYSLDGRRLNHKPTEKGVYIFNGRKNIIR